MVTFFLSVINSLFINYMQYTVFLIFLYLLLLLLFIIIIFLLLLFKHYLLFIYYLSVSLTWTGIYIDLIVDGHKGVHEE